MLIRKIRKAKLAYQEHFKPFVDHSPKETKRYHWVEREKSEVNRFSLHAPALSDFSVSHPPPFRRGNELHEYF